ncbi:MAG: ATP-binding protein [Desulfonauticus sp.]|nr:ATP-binding protein [Desulfonauticus sp.]
MFLNFLQFTHLSIRKKIIITFLILFVIVTSVSLWGFLNYNHLNQNIQLLEQKEALLNNILEARRYEKNFFITYNFQHLNKAKEFIEKSELILKKLIIPGPNSQQLFGLLENYKKSIQDILTKHNLKQLTKQKLQERSELIQKNGRMATICLEKLIAQKRKDIQRLINQSRNLLFLTITALLALAIITFIFLLKNVTKPLKDIEHAIKKIVSGDYDTLPSIQTGDEFEKLVNNINHLLTEMKLRNKQLLQKEKMAALGTLTSGVAHEINNPLNNISTSLQILQEELGDNTSKYHQELLQESLQQVDRVKEIVKGLLEFSRETSFSLAQVNFKKLVQNTLKLIQGELPSHIQIKLDIPDNLNVKIDPQRIQQVLLNIILNAIQALDKNPGTITISAYIKDHSLYFSIEDTGPGIPKTLLSKIFDPFFTTKDVGKGSGLGLAVCQGIVEKHQGKIKVSSQEGKGTKFTIVIPQKD